MENDKKINVKMVNKKYKDRNAIKNLIKYVVTDKMNGKYCRYIGGHGVFYMNTGKAVKQFDIVQEYYKKQHGRRAYHMIISFEEKVDDLCEIDNLAKRIVFGVLKDYQSVYAIHEDTDNLHIHIVWNAVSFINGKKWHMTKTEFWEFRRKIEKIAKQTREEFALQMKI